MRQLDEDAAQDARVDLLERQARGEVIRNEGGWLRRVTAHNVKHMLDARDNERQALSLWIKGGRTDLYGREPRVILRGEAYKAQLREQKRAARQRQKEAA